MIPKCKNCKYRLDHPDGLLCGKSLKFSDPDDTCIEWENEDFLNPKKMVALAIVVVGIIAILSKIL
jgi:hypothetical protein